MGHVGVVQLLLKAGADSASQNGMGESALDVANQLEQPEVRAAMVEALRMQATKATQVQETLHSL